MLKRKQRTTALVLLGTGMVGIVLLGSLIHHVEAAPAPEAREADALKLLATRGKIVDVASPIRGSLQFIGTEIKAGEDIPASQEFVAKIGSDAKTFRILKEGERVEAGQLVARIDDGVDADRIEEKRAQLDDARDEVVQTEKQMAEAKVRWYRIERLCCRREEVDSWKSQYEVWKFEALARQEQVKVAEKELEQAERQFQRHEIRSRVSGFVVSIRKQPGQGVQALEGVLRIRLDNE